MTHIKPSPDRFNCAFVAITHALRGTRPRDTSPAAAADASKWPIFDFKHADWTSREFAHNAATAAPTWIDLQFTHACCVQEDYLDRIPERSPGSMRFKRTSMLRIAY